MARPAVFGKVKPKADLGAPSGFGGAPPPPRGRAAAPPAADPDADADIDTGDEGLDTDQDADTGSPTVTPEAVSYRTADQQCNSCQYMAEDGNCDVLKMPVEENDGCNAHKARSTELETRGTLRGNYGGRSQGGGEDGY